MGGLLAGKDCKGCFARVLLRRPDMVHQAIYLPHTHHNESQFLEPSLLLPSVETFLSF